MTISPLLLRVPERMNGSRILLRPFYAGDAPHLWEALGESRSHLAASLPVVKTFQTLADVEAYVIKAHSRWLLRDGLPYGMWDPETNRFMGSVSFGNVDWSLRSCAFGYWIRPSLQGHGYISEGVQLMTRMAFESLEANRVEIRVDPRNDRGRKVAERLGFICEGTLRNAAPDADGVPRSQQVFSLTPADYATLAWATHK